MDAYDAVKAWVYSGGDDLAPWLFEQESSDSVLAAALHADWPIWSEGECPYSQAELTDAFAAIRSEF